MKHALSEAEGNLRLPNRDPSLALRMTDYGAQFLPYGVAPCAMDELRMTGCVAPKLIHIEWWHTPAMVLQSQGLI